MLFYYPILPAEMVFTIGGILLFTTTYSAIKGLKRNWVTSKPDRFTKQMLLNAEILISSQLGMQPETTTKSQMEFGGGDFSGGSSGEF
jgi:hypothetical protein